MTGKPEACRTEDDCTWQPWCRIRGTCQKVVCKADAMTPRETALREAAKAVLRARQPWVWYEKSKALDALQATPEGIREGSDAMMDPAEQLVWFKVYRDEAFKLCGRRRTARTAAIAWASSMAAIAEQFVDPDDEEMEEV